MKKVYKNALKKIGLKQTKKVLNNLSDKDQYVFNKIVLKKKGKKEYDYFYLTEPGSVNKDIFKEKSLLTWDKKSWKFQVKHGLKENSYYRLYMIGDWFRALELKSITKNKRTLIYGQIESVQSYVLQEVITKVEDFIDKKYPYLYVRPYGVPMFEKIKDKKGLSRMADADKRCGGFEVERTNMNRHFFKLIQEIKPFIDEETKHLGNYTFRKYSDKSLYDHLDFFLFGGKEAARTTSFKTFFKDFVDKQQPVELLNPIIKKVYKKLIKELKKENNEDTFNNKNRG